MHQHTDEHTSQQISPQELSRRRFLSYLAGLLTGIITLLIGVPLAGYVISPLLKKRKEIWVKLGPLFSVQPGQPKKFTYSYQLIDGWFEKTVHLTAYGVLPTETPVELIVLSNICTHLGCGVRWDDTQQAFLCPCHNGKFSLEGKVLAGPPPKPLPRLQCKVDKGMILIKVEEV